VNNKKKESGDYAITLLQIFRFMYHNCDEFHQLAAQQPDFLTALVATLYPLGELSQTQLNAPSPTEIRPFAEAMMTAAASSSSSSTSPPSTPSSPSTITTNIESTTSDLSTQSENLTTQSQPPPTSPQDQKPLLNTYSTYLSMHPARKLVMDFLRDLAYDNMLNSISAGRLISTAQASIVDTIFTYSLPLIDTANSKRNQELTTEMLKTIVDHVLASDLFNDSKSSTGNGGGFGSAASLQNLFNLMDRMVDKLWEGSYRREPKEVFDTIVKTIACIKRRFHTVSVEQLTNSMNRTLLYQLSRPSHSLTEQLETLDVLHKMSKMKQLILGTSAGNAASAASATYSYQAEFFACVTHCLLQITQKSEGESDDNTQGEF
jgi:hypothetical protein